MQRPITGIRMPNHSGAFLPEPRPEYSSGSSGPTLDLEPAVASAPYPQTAQVPTGPARASQFMDLKTGAFDVQGFFNAGMTRSKQAGDKGNLLLLDDSPQFMEHYGIRDKASVLLTGGGPGYAVSPWQHEYNGPYVPSTNDDWVMPVGMKAGSDDSGTEGSGGTSTVIGQNGKPPVPGMPDAGSTSSGGSSGHSDSQQNTQSRPYDPNDPNTWPAPTLEAWKASPWGKGTTYGPQDPTPSITPRWASPRILQRAGKFVHSSSITPRSTMCRCN